MISGLRNRVLLVLLLLQMIAPLMHAHFGEEPSAGGIHLPGLEWSNPSDSTSAVATSNVQQERGGALVCVSNAIKNLRYVKDLSLIVWQLLPIFLILAIFSRAREISPSLNFFPASLLLQSGIAARAPPGYNT